MFRLVGPASIRSRLLYTISGPVHRSGDLHTDPETGYSILNHWRNMYMNRRGRLIIVIVAPSMRMHKQYSNRDATKILQVYLHRCSCAGAAHRHLPGTKTLVKQVSQESVQTDITCNSTAHSTKRSHQHPTPGGVGCDQLR